MDAMNVPNSQTGTTNVQFTEPANPTDPNMANKERNNHDIEQNAALLKGAPLDWKPTSKEWMIMLTLAIGSFMVSLDATVIVTSLSVCTRTSWGSRYKVDANVRLRQLSRLWTRRRLQASG